MQNEVQWKKFLILNYQNIKMTNLVFYDHYKNRNSQTLISRFLNKRAFDTYIIFEFPEPLLHKTLKFSYLTHFWPKNSWIIK